MQPKRVHSLTVISRMRLFPQTICLFLYFNTNNVNLFRNSDFLKEIFE